MGKVVSMLYLILFLLLAFLHFHSAHLCLPEQRDALLEFKNTISLHDCCVDYPTNSWNESTDCCSWDGVYCHMVTGHVIGIDLRNSCLSGTLPANSSLFHLQRLQWLNLSSNDLHGSLLENSSLFNLQGLQQLNLAHNKFDGSISSELFNKLVSLTHLNLSRSGFSSSIPTSFGNLTQIIFLDFSQNNFGGKIPDAFGNLNKLTTLKFDSCNFSGQLPTTMFNLTQLTLLDLSHNQLEGPLPNHVSELQLLEGFWLSNNLISGGVPSWLFTLLSLQDLDLSHNKLTGPIGQIQKPNSIRNIDLSSNDIHGPIPSSFFDLVNLEQLDLSSNNLSGVIKSNMLAKLKNLSHLYLSNNSLLSLSTSGNDVNNSFPRLATVSFSFCSTRQFPSFFQKSNLEILDLSYNKICGGISKWEAEGWESLLELDLSNNALTTLEQFPGKNLRVLDLRSNLLQGPILSNLLIRDQSSLVFLDLSRNTLNGTIPNYIGNFSIYLKFLNLEMNNFYGKIPDSFTNDQLRYLLLNDNQLEGLLPESLANCSSLKVLNLRNNKLTDIFPHWLTSLPYLQVLLLRNNKLYGPMPNSIASSNFSSLQIIDLSHNELTGPLPTKFFQNLRAMKDVPQKRHRGPSSLGYMHYSASSSQGYMPYQGSSSRGYMRSKDKLSVIDVTVDTDGSLQKSCRYSYQDCTANGGKGYVSVYQQISMNVSVNVTMKRLEIELARTLDIFMSIDFSSNFFYGQIPKELGELISLQALNFSNNHLIGPIPTSFGNMVALESLDLSSNKLGGRIPSQLTNLTFLAVLNLSQNALAGPIPRGKQFDTFENDSYSGNLGLCGPPLSKQCGNDEEPKPPVPMPKEDEGSEIAFFWKVVMMGYGCGVVLGLSMGYIVFTTGRPWWFIRMVERDWQNNVTKWIRRNRGRRN